MNLTNLTPHQAAVFTLGQMTCSVGDPWTCFFSMWAQRAPLLEVISGRSLAGMDLPTHVHTSWIHCPTLHEAMTAPKFLCQGRFNKVFFFFETVSFCSPGCAQTHYPPASASSVMGLQVHLQVQHCLHFYDQWGVNSVLGTQKNKWDVIPTLRSTVTRRGRTW